ncbi:MAG TPA: DUF1365 domain-containing protein [Aromatoleum sp.]|uniref:DUF1365 domain-containing protein n=1 Tax=Aromatoleum sp. TaxID=2307007 RepID=UPI002B477457|nr:DUF1365 domain-containing protein [Aromatoleum sp.]HJV25144.1 DUF1365 domain-containing protein [Aromatoleum sp.]
MGFRPQLFFGQVMHRRLRPRINDFVYPVFYVQLPLRDLASANCGVFSVDRPNLLSFRSEDHGPRDGSPLLPWIRGLLRERGLPDDGEVVLQTFPRVLGYVFNPVSFWYCHARDQRLVAILVEVNNTFGGTYGYVLHRHGKTLAEGEALHAEKVFHVSPFNEVQGGYRFRFQLERRVQVARIDYDDAEGELLRTSISGSPRPWTRSALLSALLRMPFMTLGVMVRIHWQALRLWLKGVPFHGAHAVAPAAEPLGKSTK